MNTDDRHREILRNAQTGLDRAAATARERARQFETPVWVWENGKWVDANVEPETRYQPKKSEPARLREDPEESPEG